MGLLKRIFGICETKKPRDSNWWNYGNGKVMLDWARVPELHKPCGAVRIEGKKIPGRIIVIQGFDGQFHAFMNQCTHMGRRIDPVADTTLIRCCSLNKSTFDYTGNVMSGPAKESLRKLRVETRKCKVIVWFD
jgi:nitrite reductase/ring-hydroxylating ferredoxin subunit